MACVRGAWTSHARIILLYVLTFGVILPVLCSKLKYSVYFRGWESSLDARIKAAKRDNAENVKHANDYLKNTTKMAKVDHPDIVITIVATDRDTRAGYILGYTTQSFAKLMYLIKERYDGRLRFDVALCNVDTKPDTFLEFHQLKDLTQNAFTRFTESETKKRFPNVKEKEKQDYVFCLNRSLALRPQHVILLEDDAVPEDDFLDAVDWLLTVYFRDTELDHHVHTGSRKLQQTAYIKLYHPERLHGYFSSVYNVLELIALSATLGTILVCIYFNIWPKGSKRSVINVMIWFILWLYMFLLLAAVGKQSFLSLRTLMRLNHHYVSPDRNCCTPAVLFPSHNAPHVVRFLNQTTCTKSHSKDHVLDDLVSKAKDSNLTSFLVQPNIVRHVGFYSAVHKKFVDPIIV